jgi:alpha-mannosidase
VIVTLVPHTHWDREWYEPFDVFVERLVAMMDRLCDLADGGFPHFHLDGQTAMIDDYLARRPERTEEVRKHVRAGRLSAGPWVTQMDEFLASGESHLRNLEMGLARARELGRALEVGYLPDQFGHVGQMPQLLRMFGIERAVVWRGVPRAIARDAFRWRAPDGSEVVADYLAFGYFNGARFLQAADAETLAAQIRETLERQRPLLVRDRLLVMVGADHAGPDPTLPARVEAASALLEEADVRIAGLREHLAGAPVEDLPLWTGELRSAARAHLLPNVVSARVHQKRERGRLEALVERVAEPLASLVPGVAWPTADLERVWTLLCWNGAHDSACGCSHDRVARDVDARFAEVRAIARRIVDASMDALGSLVGAAGTLRFNPSPFEREAIPGLGWRVLPEPSPPADLPVELRRLPGGEGVLVAGTPVRLLDEPDVGDLYTFCPAEGGRPAAPDSIEVEEGGVRARWEGLEVHLRARRRVEEPFVRLEGVVVNGRADHRLRVHVGVDGPADGSLAASVFELVRRPLVGEGGVEMPSPTWPARGVVAAGGTAVLADGVFEYEVVDRRELAVTLLRAVGTISREDLATRRGPAGPATPTPGAQLLGPTRFALAVWPRAPVDDPPALLAGWERFGVPILDAQAAGGGHLPSVGSLLQELDLGGAQLSSVRRTGEGVEVRLWNPWVDRSVRARVEGLEVELGPARIGSVRVER